MTSQRKYRHAPLAYAILQVTHPPTPVVSKGEEYAIKAALREHVPLASRETFTQVDIRGTVGDPNPQATSRNEDHVRFSSRDKRTIVTYAPSSMTIETTNYDSWTWLRALASTALVARMDIAPVDGVERIGLRFIDEVRIPGESEPDWEEWVDAQLVAPDLSVVPGRLRPLQQQSVVQYGTASAEALVTLRYGAVNGPSVVQGTPLAQGDLPPAGPFFLIDTDAAWAPGPGQDVPPLEPNDVLSKADNLHDYVKELFEASLTQRLRDEVLNAQ